MFNYFAKQRNLKNGFTLLELLVTSSILVVILVGTLLLFINSAFLLESSKNTIIALNHAQTVLEEVRKVSSSSLNNVVSVNWPTWAANNGLNTLKEENIQVSIVNPSADPLDITVTLNWKDRMGRARAINLRQLVTQR